MYVDTFLVVLMPMRNRMITIDEETEKWLSNCKGGASAAIRSLVKTQMAIHAGAPSIGKLMDEIINDEEKLKTYHELVKSKAPELLEIQDETKKKFGKYIFFEPTKESIEYAVMRLKEKNLPIELLFARCHQPCSQANTTLVNQPEAKEA